MKSSTWLILLFCLYCCSTKERSLPILSYRIDEGGNKVEYTITYNEFTNQFGESFNTKDLSNKIVLSNFFFTKCPSICPPMRNALIALENDFRDEDDFLIISHTIDPKNDTIPVLYKYWEATGVSKHHWQFLYTTEELMKKQAAQFMTSFKQNEDASDFYHSSYITLLDKKQQIRGFYNSLIPEELERLKKDISYLLKN